VVAVVCLGCVDDGSAKVDSGLVGQTDRVELPADNTS
jgi:hypothetical protein